LSWVASASLIATLVRFLAIPELALPPRF